MKRKVNLFIFVFVFISLASLAAAATVEDNLPVQIQSTNNNGEIVTGTFDYTVNISNSASNTCDASNIVYSNSTTKTTDNRGIVTYQLNDVGLDFDEQYWFCYYRDGNLEDTVEIGRSPYAFTADGLDTSEGLIQNVSDINGSDINNDLGWINSSQDKDTNLSGSSAGGDLSGTYPNPSVDHSLADTLNDGNSANQDINLNGNNIQLNDGWLSNDGNNEGVRIFDDGHIGLGTGTRVNPLFGSRQVTIGGDTVITADMDQTSASYGMQDINSNRNYFFYGAGIHNDAKEGSVMGGYFNMGTDNHAGRFDMRFAGDERFWFYEDGTMLQDGSGNVGIGYTPSNLPSAKLDVNGTFQVASGTSVNNIDTSTSLGTSDNALATQNAIKTYVDNNDDVGIASLSGGDGISPGSIGDGDTVEVAWSDASALNSNGNINDFSNANDLDGSGNVNANVESLSTSLSSGSIAFSDGSSLTEDNSNLFWDNSNNRLGIRTTNPSTQLEVVGDIRAGDGGSSNFAWSGYHSGNDEVFYSRGNTGDHDITIGPSGDIAMAQGTGGNLGVGTDSPSEKLDVDGSFSAESTGSSIELNDNGNVRIGI